MNNDTISNGDFSIFYDITRIEAIFKINISYRKQYK